MNNNSELNISTFPVTIILNNTEQLWPDDKFFTIVDVNKRVEVFKQSINKIKEVFSIYLEEGKYSICLNETLVHPSIFWDVYKTVNNTQYLLASSDETDKRYKNEMYIRAKDFKDNNDFDNINVNSITFKNTDNNITLKNVPLHIANTRSFNDGRKIYRLQLGSIGISTHFPYVGIDDSNKPTTEKTIKKGLYFSYRAKKK